MRKLFLRDRQGWREILIDESTKRESGREGDIYVTPDGEFAIKLFVNADQNRLALKRRKVAAMLDDGFVAHFLQRQDPDFAWPMFTVHAAQREDTFIGFGMRYLRDYHSLDRLLTPTDIYADFPYLLRVLVCSYLAHLFVLCHSRDVVVGDVKPNNIVVRGDGNHVALIDCDSFQFSFKGAEYTTDLATFEYAAPRLIQIIKAARRASLENVRRNFSDDTFALAVLCFRLLMNGFHPFHAAKGKTFDNIQNRVFAYAGGDVRPPQAAPVARYEQLPFDIKQLFESAFSKAEYISAVRWRDAFYKYAGDIEISQVTPTAPFEPRPETPKASVPPLLQAPQPITPKPGFWARLWKWLTGS